MRRTLLDLQAVVEGLRAALCLDLAHDHPDAARRERASVEASLLTPIAKAFATHIGFQGVSNALQVFGGYGYIGEFGVEQSLRDVRIAMIYEGTNACNGCCKAVCTGRVSLPWHRCLHGRRYASIPEFRCPWPSVNRG